MKIGVIGVGHLGQHHARVYKELPEVELVGIYDPDKQNANRIAAKNNCKIFSTSKELINSVDIIDISSPTTTHYDYAKQSLLANKHVFVEKPICSKAKEAKELVKLSQKKGLKVQVGHIERFNPAVVALTGILVNPLFIEANRIAPFTPRGSDVPVVLDLMIHDIDIILSLINSNVNNLKAVGVPILTNDIDIANAKLEFENGAIANITASRISLKRERKIRFFQKDMYISLDYQSKKVNVVKRNKGVEGMMDEIMSGKREANILDLFETQKLDINDIEPLKAEIVSFLDSIRNDTKPVVNAQDGYQALKIAFTIMEDIEKNRKEVL